MKNGLSSGIKIFPDLARATWAEVSLDALSRQEFNGKSNPLIDPQQCDDWVKKIAAQHHVDYTYGGYLEDRSHLWRGHYLPKGPQAHLGVDYNVPAGTKVIILSDAEVMHVGRDGSFGGWGGVLVFRLDKPPYKGADYLYYGHLAWDDTVSLGQKLKAGTLVGHIGKPHENGVWFPHLHVQMVSEREMKRAKNGNPEAVDGYRSPPVSKEDFPDPHPYVLGKI
ncbi:MAG: peptidoglycan DD-metalloendopeptidase family protein [Proteobacteria bacterium]|nr:peptidoglycan DD-metalloendopeptidase family protein [Pseudomonadota bacterium]